MQSILASLPTLNAILNSIAAVLLVLGFAAIKAGDRSRHRRYMLSTAVVSGIFLVSYVIKTIYHGTTLYGGTGLSRVVYLSVLFSHLTLAIGLVPLAAVTLIRGLQARFDRHRAIARWTLPIWLYVSVTGVLVYLMLRPWY